MIMADKIMQLRKKEGWSQEQLANKIGVSRQAISKWESGQSVPDMKKLLKLAKVFDVSTDYLLRDELEQPTAPAQSPADRAVDDEGEPLTQVSLEEANSYLEHAAKSATWTALGVMLCILSPIATIILTGLAESRSILMGTDEAGILGAICLLVLIAIAVGIFVHFGTRSDRFAYLEKENLDTAYGVEGMVTERKERYRTRHARELAIGIVLCILAVVPMLGIISFSGDTGEAMTNTLGVGILLAIVAVGVFLIVRTCMINDGFDVLLEQGDYTRDAKQERSSFAGYYWAIVLAVYLLWSFLSNQWDTTWIIWPIAGILYGVFAELFRKRRAK
ncbi:MAG: helix-turn-helix domain-containing protein [Eggerthellaceae bacterium]|jgi:transcriptional regulator with XRE-family HTH domain